MVAARGLRAGGETQGPVAGDGHKPASLCEGAIRGVAVGNVRRVPVDVDKRRVDHHALDPDRVEVPVQHERPSLPAGEPTDHVEPARRDLDPRRGEAPTFQPACTEP